MLYSLKAWGSRISNMTFPCVNPIQLGHSPFNSSPQCKKALYVIISGEILENYINKIYMDIKNEHVHVTFANLIFINFAENDDIKSFFTLWGRVEWD